MDDRNSSSAPFWRQSAANGTTARPVRCGLAGFAAAFIFLVNAPMVLADPFDDARAALARGDSATAERIYRSLADQGHVAALTQLGLMYRSGRGATRDYSEALKLLDRAAALGSSEAQYQVGDMYLRGVGMEQDLLQAARYYNRAAEQGHARAQYVLGVLYKLGGGVRRNYAKAARWFGRSAAQGVPEAQLELGLIHSNGLGVPRDYVEAVKWLTLARTSNASSRTRTQAAEALTRIEGRMTPAQLAQARADARTWRSAREGAKP